MMTTTNTNRYIRTLAVIAALAVTSSGLLAAQARPAEAAFPGENGKIVFTSDRTTGQGVNNPEGDREIFSMNPDGTGLKQLTHNPWHDIAPALSPSGIQIAFTSYKDGDGEIYTMDINGSVQTRLTDNAVYDGEPSFSPLLPNGSGIDIAFTSGRDSNDLDFEIYKMNADGTEQDRLTEGPGTDEAPSWSPDGKKIAFTSDRETADNPYGDDEIYTMDPDGSNPTNVSNTDKWSRDEAPSWSPDGKEIAFQSNRNANDWEIYKMKADGTQQINLTNNASSPDFHPSWSPSGTQIAFETLRDGDREIYTMRANGLGQINRTNYHPSGNNLSGQDSLPDWGRKPILQQP
jgi:Tol biopolymer transport system component